MERLLTLSRITILVIAFITASCGQSANNEDSASTPIIMHMGMNMGKDSVMYETAELLKQSIAKDTGGKIQLQIHPSQGLGNDQQMVEMCITGRLDMAIIPTAKISYIAPSFSFFDLPFYLPEREDVYTLLDGEFGDLLMSRLEPFGLKGITVWENGFKQFTANTPLKSPEDYEGQIFRIMKNPVIYDQFRALGAQPVPIDFYKTLTALKDGAVDGQENPISAIYHMNFYRYQKYLTVSNHAYLGYVFIMSSSALDKLTPEEKELVTSRIKSLTPYQRNRILLDESGQLEDIIESGVTVEYLTKENKEQFDKKLFELRNKYWTLIGDDLMNIADDYLSAKYDRHNSDTYAIGISAPLTGFKAQVGQAVLTGMQMAVEEINRNGGIKGKMLRIVQLDNKNSDEIHMKNLEILSKYKNLLGIYAGESPERTAAGIEYASSAGIPFISAIHPPSEGYKENPQVFSITGRLDDIADAIATESLRTSKKSALITVNDHSASTIAEKIFMKLNRKDAPPIILKQFAIAEDSFMPMISELSSLGVENVIYVGSSMELITFINASKTLGKSFRIIANNSICGNAAFKELVDISKGMDVKYLVPVNKETINHKKLNEVYKKCTMCPQDYDIPPISLNTYDITMMLAQAAERSEQTDSKNIVKNLSATEYFDGIAKKYTRPFGGEIKEAVIKNDLGFRTIGD
jgi:tripartite ATP-independent transporter DctP family solute receptor